MAKNIQEHLERIKSQRAPWDEADVAKRNARLDLWFQKVLSLPIESAARAIITHNRPHSDEVLMAFLAAKYPSALFGSIAHIIKLDELEDEERPFGENIILRTEGGSYQNTNWLTHWRNGLRLLGTGGGVLDEHLAKGEPRIENESGATLMARLLGIVDKEELRRLLNVVRKLDTAGNLYALLKGFDIKEAHRESNWKDIRTGSAEDKAHQLIVIRKGLVWLNTFIERELRIINEFRLKGYLRKVDAQGNVLIGRLRSDLPVMIDYIREKYGTSLVIQKGRSGRATILMDKSKLPPDVMVEIVQAIRTEEAHINNRPLPADQNELRENGRADCAPEWHYDNGFMLLNDSESYPDAAPPTRITSLRLEDIAAEILAAKADRIREWKKGEKEKKSEHYKQQARK